MSYEYQLKLKSLASNKGLTHDGKFIVTLAGVPERAAITDYNDAVITQPGNMVDGVVKFRTAETILAVDIYIYSEFGYCKVLSGVKAGTLLEVGVNTDIINVPYIIPFDIDDAAIVANVEYDTGLDLATGQQVMPYGSGVRITTLDAGMTIDAGFLNSESSGDADGIIDGISLASAVFVPATVTIAAGVVAASPTRGALLADHTTGTNADDRGLHSPKTHVCDGTNKSLSLTLSASTDTGAGYLVYQTLLPRIVD